MHIPCYDTAWTQVHSDGAKWPWGEILKFWAKVNLLLVDFHKYFVIEMEDD